MPEVLNDAELRKDASSSRKKADELEHRCKSCDPRKIEGYIYLAKMYRRSAQNIEDYLFNKNK